jgi:hypothetical protein
MWGASEIVDYNLSSTLLPSYASGFSLQSPAWFWEDVLLRGWSTRASINRNSSSRAHSFWSITTVRKQLSSSLSLSHTHWVSEMHMASQLFVITEIALGRYTQGASKSGMFVHAWFEVFLLFEWNFWALMGDEKFGCGKVSLLYIPLLSEEFWRA